MKKITINVEGMHCRSCELTLEKTISKLPNIHKVNANQYNGKVDIEYSGNVDINKIEAIIIENGYKVGEKKKQPWLQKDLLVYYEVFAVAFIFYIIYQILQNNGVDFSSTNVVGSPTLGIVLLIGLTAGVSSCMALVGGLVLGVAAKLNQNKSHLTAWQKFYPHIYFNLGRIVGFGIFGAILGALGSVLSLSISVLAIFTLIVGGIMLLLGINLTEISPRLANISITLPKFLTKNLGENNNNQWGALITGALTFFLPCGFTLAMQVYAMSSGSWIMGGLIMAMFAIGTAPGLIGVGGFTSIFKGGFAKRFFRYVGVLVILLGIFNITNSWNLLKSSAFASKIDTANVDTSNLEVQEVRIKQLASGYDPKVVYIQPGKKIRLTVESKSPYSCASWFVIPAVGVNKQLEAGENVFEFVSPSKEGQEVPFSCIMGMYTGKFVVKSKESTKESKAPEQTNPTNDIRGDMKLNNKSNVESLSSNSQQVSAESKDVEVINLEYTSNGLPNVTLKSGKKYKIVINAKTTVNGCMSTILIPGLDENIQEVVKGTQIVFNVAPTQAGQSAFICAMGVPHSYISIE